MSKETTENIGVNLLKNLFLKTEKVSTSTIAANDKGVSWDGFIDVFKNKKCSKKDLLGRIPLQIKTIKSNGKTKNFPISKADMENYRKEKRIIYFYIRESSDSHFSFYYLPLQLWDINNYLKKYGNKNKKSFEFAVFPEDQESIYAALCNFIDDYEKRNAVMPNINSIEELLKQKGNQVDLSFSIKCRKGATYNDVIKAIKVQRPYVTYKCKDSGLDLTIDRLCKNKEAISFHKKVIVSINDKAYFDNSFVVFSEDCIVVHANDNLEIHILGNDFTFKFNLSPRISDRLEATKFLVDLINNKHFSINKDTFNIYESEANRIKNHILAEYDLYYKISSVLKVLRVKKQPVFDNVCQRDIEYLNIIYESLINNVLFDLEKYNSPFGFFKLLGLSLYVNVEPCKDGYSLHNWHEGKIKLTSMKGEEFVASSAFYLSIPDENILSEVDNVNYEELVDIFCNANENESQFLSWVVINLIKHFDNTNDMDAIIAAKKICISVVNKEQYDVSTIVNLSQIFMRLGENNPEIYNLKLRNYLEAEGQNHLTRFCIFVALNELQKAEQEIKKCNEEDMKTLTKWPIYSCYIARQNDDKF